MFEKNKEFDPQALQELVEKHGASILQFVQELASMTWEEKLQATQLEYDTETLEQGGLYVPALVFVVGEETLDFIQAVSDPQTFEVDLDKVNQYTRSTGVPIKEIVDKIVWLVAAGNFDREAGEDLIEQLGAMDELAVGDQIATDIVEKRKDEKGGEGNV